jgi:F0F1-type ATP synthase membrane subunit b/b'
MTPLLLLIIGLALILTLCHFLLYRPIKALLAEAGRSMEAHLDEARRFSESARQAEVDRQRIIDEAKGAVDAHLLESIRTMEHLRTAAVDLIRQESHRIVADGVKQLHSAKQDTL